MDALEKVKGVIGRDRCDLQGVLVIVEAHPFNDCQRYRRLP